MTSPTTPRDDIAGLTGLLEKFGIQGELAADIIELIASSVEMGRAEAATQLGVLTAKVKELKAERRRYDAEVRSWKLDHDRKLASVRRQATRLQQERDDAYERLKDHIDHFEGGLQLLSAAVKTNDPQEEILCRVLEEQRQIAIVRRQLASGPDKEKRE
jgi:hypothetical protein